MIQIKTVAAICRKSNMIRLIYTTSGQWVGDSMAMYCADSLPVMDAETVKAVFDIREKDADAILMEVRSDVTSPQYMTYPELDDDLDAQVSPMKIKWYGVELDVFGFGDEVFMVNSKYLKPIKADQSRISYHMRSDALGNVVIVVQEGAFPVAVLWALPEEYLSKMRWPLERIVECLKGGCDTVKDIVGKDGDEP